MSTQVRDAIRHWPHVAPLLEAPRSKRAYRRLVAALDAVLDAARPTRLILWRAWRLSSGPDRRVRSGDSP